MEFLLHAHGGVRAIHYELIGVVEVHAEPFSGVVVVAWRRVDQAVVALKR